MTVSQFHKDVDKFVTFFKRQHGLTHVTSFIDSCDRQLHQYKPNTCVIIQVQSSTESASLCLDLYHDQISATIYKPQQEPLTVKRLLES